MARFLFSAFADEAAPDLAGQIAACKRHGIAAIELRGVDGENISDISIETANSIKARLDDAGIAVSSIGSKYGKEAFDFEAFKNTVAVAKILEAAYIRMFSFYEGSQEERFAAVRAMAEYAKSHGVICCHENEKGIYGDTPERCLELLQAVPELGCVFDFANFMECGCDTMEAYQLLKSHITYFHIKDYCPDWKAVVPANWGGGRLAEILADYDKSNLGTVWLSMEPHLKVFDGLGGFDEETKQKLANQELYATQEESFAKAAEQMMATAALAQPVAIGIVGYGNMGTAHMQMHLEGAHKNIRIAAVADIKPERLAAAQKDLPGVAVYNNAKELIDGGLCTAVLICTPHYDHPGIAIAALKAGLHVMTEKPAGVYTKQVRAMNEAAEGSDKIFAIMYNQRTNPLYQTMRALVQGGEYGQLRRVTWLICDWYRTQAYYNSGGWRATWAGEGGGVLINQCPHNFDLWQWICGMPCNVRASCHEGKWHNIEVEDDVTIYAEYPNGATGVFITTTGEPAGANRLEITLDKAKLISENGKLIVTEFESTQNHLDTCPEGFAMPAMKTYEMDIPPQTEKQHAQSLNAFAQAILTGDRALLFAKGEEGIRGLSVSNAAHLSSWLGRSVALPIDEDLFWAELQKKIAASQTKETVVETVTADMTSTF